MNSNFSRNNCTIDGGGFYAKNSSSTIYIYNSSFDFNNAYSDGGAIYVGRS